MTSFLGMDVAAIRTLAQQMASAANDITNHANTINNALQSAQWNGTDANNFRQDWGTHFTNLNNIASALSDASTHANQNADQQEQASNS
jgi:hypothetical protein